MEIKQEPEVVTIDDSDEESKVDLFDNQRTVIADNQFFHLNQNELTASISTGYPISSNCFCYECGQYSNSYSSHKPECSFNYKAQYEKFHTSMYLQQINETVLSHRESVQKGPSYPQYEVKFNTYEEQGVEISKSSYESYREKCFSSNNYPQKEECKSNCYDPFSTIRVSSFSLNHSDHQNWKNYERSAPYPQSVPKRVLSHAPINNDLYSNANVGLLKNDDVRAQSETSERKQYACTHACLFCPKLFITKSILNAHTLYDCENKPLVCRICCTRFTTNTHLMRHQNSDTCIEKPYECMGCKNRYVSKKSLSVHHKHCAALVNQ